MSLRPGELKRGTFKQSMPTEPKVRKKKCRVCKELFTPRSAWAKACSISCAQEHVRLERAKKDRQERQKGLQALKTKRDYIKECQIAFNAYIRIRDQLAGHPCISSGRQLDWSGNAVDAGHYRSVGSAPHLRFNEDNCHAQSKHDNQWKSGNAVDYRLGLIARIGLERVEVLESDNRIKRWTIEELKDLRDHYRAKLKELKKEKRND